MLLVGGSSRAMIASARLSCFCTVSPLTSLQFFILFSLYWIKITEHIEYKLLSLTKFSQPPDLHICVTSSLFSLLANSLVISIVHPHYLLYE